MEIAYQASKILSIALFLYYGLTCLFTDVRVAEFERFRLGRFRILTGSLEVLGALGLLAGYLAPFLVIVGAGGLALLMVLGVATRLRIRDSLVQMLPAIVLMLVNLYILVYALERVA